MTVFNQPESNKMESTKGIVNKKLLGHRIQRQQGTFVTELGIALLVLGLIGAAAYVFVPRMLANIRADKIVNEFNVTIPSIQTAYQNRTSYNSLTTAQVAQNGWMSRGFVEYSNDVPTGSLLTPWGVITFASASSGSQGQVTLTNVPSIECTKIGTSFASDMFLGATVNGTAVKSGVNSIDLTAVGTQCSSSDSNTVVFTFGRS